MEEPSSTHAKLRKFGATEFKVTVVRTSSDNSPISDYHSSHEPDPFSGLSSSYMVDPLYLKPTVDFRPSSIPCAPGVTPPPSNSPIPAHPPATGNASKHDSSLSSLVYSIDRMGRREVAIKPGTIDGIRRMSEIHGFVARYFDDRTVAIGPGVTGYALPHHLKALNERVRPLYEAYKLPARYANRLCVGAGRFPRGGGWGKEEYHAISEADFASWGPNQFGKYTSTASCSMGREAESPITSRRGVLIRPICQGFFPLFADRRTRQEDCIVSTIRDILASITRTFPRRCVCRK